MANNENDAKQVITQIFSRIAEGSIFSVVLEARYLLSSGVDDDSDEQSVKIERQAIIELNLSTIRAHARNFF